MTRKKPKAKVVEIDDQRPTRGQGEKSAVPTLTLEHGPGRTVAIKVIDHGPFQVRPADTIADLADSIAKDGLLQPITVRLTPRARTSGQPERFEVIAGHRRLEACKSLGHETIRVQVFELDDEAAYRISLIENMKRVDLNPLEEARSFVLAHTMLGWDEKKVAAALNRPPAYVKQRLALLELPDILQHQVEGGLSPAKAFALAPLDQFMRVKGGGPGVLVKMDYVKAQHDQTVHQVEEWVAEYFKSNAFNIGKEWDTEICAKNGCLGQVNGSKVCLNLQHAFEVRISKYEQEMAAALEDFLNKPGNTGVTREMKLPVFYDLDLVSPNRWGDGTRYPKAFPRCPKKVNEYTYGDETGAKTWKELRMRVTGQALEKCQSCPAWKGKAAGRAILVDLDRGYHGGRYETHLAVDVICMDAACRGRQIKASLKDSDKGAREQAKEAKIKREQQPLAAHAETLVQDLEKNRLRLLAAYLLNRDRQSEVPQLRYHSRDIAQEIGLKVPEHDNTPNGALKALMSVGEDGLFRLIAEYVVRHFDNARQSVWLGSDKPSEIRWSVNALAATTGFLFGEDRAQALKDQMKTLNKKAKGKK